MLSVTEALDAVEPQCRRVDPHYGEGSYFHVHRVRFAYTLMELVRVPAPERFLEVGSDGLFLRLMRQVRGTPTVVGSRYTTSEPHIVVGDDPERFTFLAADLERTQFPCVADAFDLVLCGEIIEHMAVDPMALLAELNRVIETGGRLVLTTPNAVSWRSIQTALEKRVPLNAYEFRRSGSFDRHHFEYTPELLAEVVRAAGFEVERLETEDCWSLPNDTLVRFMDKQGYDQSLRRDNIFLTARKIGPVADRYPAVLYKD